MTTKGDATKHEQCEKCGDFPASFSVSAGNPMENRYWTAKVCVHCLSYFILQSKSTTALAVKILPQAITPPFGQRKEEGTASQKEVLDVLNKFQHKLLSAVKSINDVKQAIKEEL